MFYGREIQAGDYVWSENTETGEKELKRVTDVIVTMTDQIVYVTTENGEEIHTTENHPFYVEGKGWCVAAELEAGDVLHTKDGQEETVVDVTIEKQEEPVKVYNLTIEDYHTYYVSEDSVLVHNECMKSNYRSEYIKENPGMPNEYQVHHTLLQKYFNLLWGSWDRNLDHAPNKEDVMEFAQTVDKLFGIFWYKES